VRLPLGLALLAGAPGGRDPRGQLENFERRTLDARARHHAAPTPFTERIVILDITEETIGRLAPLYGRWPWPRSLHGEVAEYLAADGARAIGFDLLFAEPVTRREVDLADWEGLAALARSADLAEVRGELVRRIEALQPGLGDRAFVASVARAGNVFQAAVFAPGQPGTQPDATAVAPPVPVAARAEAAVRGQSLLPFVELAGAARGIGHINALPDADGTYRRFVPLLWQGNRQAAYPALGLAIAAHVKGVPLASMQRTAEGLAVGDAVLPLAADDSAWIRYQGGTLQRSADGSETFRSFYRHIPYEQVLAAKDLRAAGQEAPLPAGAFRNKIVLVSAQAAGLSDLRATPFSPVTPGIELHANIIDSLLAGRFLRAPAAWAVFLMTLALCVATTFIAQKLRFRLGVPLFAALAGGHAGVAWAAYGAGWVLPLVPPLAALALAYGGMLLARAALAERDRRWLRTAFGHYLAPSVLDEVLRQPDKLRLGGERRRMTVLFSDVAGFTTMSEKLPPEEVSALLNGYLDRMTACVTQTGGTLDKFVGDAVMAEWNAPLAQPDHAARACETALLMLEEVGRQDTAWRAAGAALDIRIGINTGEMVVGNMGSHQVFDYTVIGNEVNTASRLEPLNKAFGTRILVAGTTRAEAEAHRPGRFAFRPLGRVSPKGRAEPLDIFELGGRHDQLDDAARTRLADFEAAMTHYLARRFDAALSLFRAVQARQPDDGPAAAFAALCEDHLAHPPPAGWNGVFVQTEK
jgi:adenylate cyclase